jgi:hypothetical protein
MKYSVCFYGYAFIVILSSALGAFEKVLKGSVSFVLTVCLSVRPSIRMEQPGSHRPYFREI